MFKKRLLPLLFSLVFISGCTLLLNPDIASQSMPQEQVKEGIDKVLADEEPITEASTEATTEEAAGDASAATSASTSESQDASATTASSASSANAVPHLVQAQNEILAIFNYNWQKIQGTMDFNTLLAKLEELGV